MDNEVVRDREDMDNDVGSGTGRTWVNVHMGNGTERIGSLGAKRTPQGKMEVTVFISTLSDPNQENNNNNYILYSS